MYEHHKERLLSRTAFLRRLARHFAVAVLVVAASLFVGMAGYVHFEGLGWLDAFLNAAMLLGGMGPIWSPATLWRQALRRRLCPVRRHGVPRRREHHPGPAGAPRSSSVPLGGQGLTNQPAPWSGGHPVWAIYRIRSCENAGEVREAGCDEEAVGGAGGDRRSHRRVHGGAARGRGGAGGRCPAAPLGSGPTAPSSPGRPSCAGRSLPAAGRPAGSPAGSASPGSAGSRGRRPRASRRACRTCP